MEKIPIKCIKEETRIPNKLEGFRIYNLEKILKSKEMNQKVHRHDFFFFLFIEKGAGVHIVDFQEFEIENYDFYFLKPGQVHSIILKPETKGYILQFQTGFISMIKFNFPTRYQLGKTLFSEILLFLKKMELEYEFNSQESSEIVRNCISIVLTDIIRQLQKKETTENSFYQEKLNEFQALIELNYKEENRISFYTNKLSISTFQLNSITKKLLDKTASQCIYDFLILESKRKLLSSSAQVQEIATSMGFDDYSYFIRFFKKHTGQSPQNFRNSYN